MAIDLACPKCQQKYRLKDELAGKKAKCVKCGESIRVPVPAPVAPLTPVAAVAEPLPDLSDLFDDFPAAPAKPLAPLKSTESARPAAPSTSKSSCPGCGAAMDKSAVICVKCGYNARTRQTLSTKHETIDAPSPKRAKSSAATLLKGTVFSLFGAMIGAAVWVGIVIATGYEIGYVAWGLGGAAGVGMAMGHDDDDGTFAGIIAAAMSLGGIIAAKFFMFEHFKSELGHLALEDVADIEGLEGVGQQDLAQIGQLLQENITFASMFGPIDALFILLAVGTAYKLGSGQATD